MASTDTPSLAHEFPTPIELDDDSDYDSDDCSTASSASFYSLQNFSTTGSTSSLDLSTLFRSGGEDQFHQEYNRRYHAVHTRRWPIPNDEQEQDRMQIMDQMMNLLLNGDLHTVPLENPCRILDVGTGTGIWACDMAHKFPNARVFGLDLSSIQVPPPVNVRWDIEDANERWIYPPNYFSLIHTRELVSHIFRTSSPQFHTNLFLPQLGGISDWRNFFSRSFRCLHPGGWLELQEFPFRLHSANPDISPDLPLFRGNQLFRESMAALGYDVSDEIHNFIEYLTGAGFVDVREEVVQVPIGPWRGSPTEKQIGRYLMLSMCEAAEGHLLAPLNKAMGMEPDEVRQLANALQKDLLNKRHRLYLNLHIIRARKPTACEVPPPNAVRPPSSSSSGSKVEI
ncbi:S-adenosyl-L-methionine-dependent methyltransferase [Ascodesmis nigricans]|uniref:S-adenosyl-L-methionine-dependent methyltransferase n=1 Tax=Ascodesmis nigricans TaxID=341454 RepID=A0A4S2MXI5_9PEZI|nr:S-adenosyl-L-methionine-dependent methyltransferase [Ascodesmis nigricans]